jgi:hypothetical protein
LEPNVRPEAGGAGSFLETRTMPSPMTAQEVLDREFLEVRARLIQLAASLDRLDRSEGSVAADPRLAGIDEALAVLRDSQPDRAERIQQIFSRAYDPAWREKLLGSPARSPSASKRGPG